MPNLKDPPKEFLGARRALEELPFLEILEDWMWYVKLSKWVLRCRIHIDVSAGSLIPTLTDWYVVVPPLYPRGDIDIYPAKQGGISSTFQHQDHNSMGQLDLPWREGKICVQTSLRLFEKRGYDQEPITSDARLSWHLYRAHEWLVAASQGNLAQPGDPFELPFVPRQPKRHIGFIEDSISYTNTWKTFEKSYGYAKLVQFGQHTDIQAIKSLYDSTEQELFQYHYGYKIEEYWTIADLALWIKLKSVPVLPPWQIPMSLGELQTVLTQQGIDLKALISHLSRRIRDGKRHLMLLGFPISNKIGEEAEFFHWFCFLLPKLTTGTVKGFRPIESTYKLQDEQKVLKDDVKLEWIKTSNWHSDEIGARSRFSPSIRESKIAIIGAGALGSCVAQLLVRAGINNVLLIDHDLLEIGNLCRHTAAMIDIERPKALSVMLALNSISPHVRTNYIPKEFSELNDQERTLIRQQDVIFDCTASDYLISDLSQFDWQKERFFISASLGLYAKQLFYFAYHGNFFPAELYMNSISPYISEELDEYKGLELPREGVGCWHPIFPARMDDIWLMASMIVKLFEHDYRNQPISSVFRVYEQQFRDGLPLGLRNVHEVYSS